MNAEIVFDVHVNCIKNFLVEKNEVANPAENLVTLSVSIEKKSLKKKY